MKGVPLQRDSLVDGLTGEIERMVRDGELKPGERLPSLTELQSHFSVGHSTVREAVRGLSLLGVLVMEQGRGTRVSQDAPRILQTLSLLRMRLEGLDALTLYEARSTIEVSLTCLAAQRATDQDIAQIERALERSVGRLTDPQAYVEADYEFHRAVAHAGHNHLLEQFYFISREMLLEFSREVTQIPSIKQHAVPLEQRILESIRDHDPESARHWAEEHMRDLGEILSASLQVGRTGPPSQEELTGAQTEQATEP